MPGPAALGIGVVVELVHHHRVDVELLAFAQRLVGQDLRGAADDGGGGIDGGVPGDHADVVRSEQAHQLEEFLADQGLERGRVVGAAAAGERGRVGRERDHGLARSRGGGGDDVPALQDPAQSLVLVRVEGAAGGLGPLVEGEVDLLGLGHPLGVVGRNEGVEHRIERRSRGRRGGWRHAAMVSRAPAGSDGVLCGCGARAPRVPGVNRIPGIGWRYSRRSLPCRVGAGGHRIYPAADRRRP